MHLYFKSVEQLVFVQIGGLSEVNQVPTSLIYPCPEAQFVSIIKASILFQSFFKIKDLDGIIVIVSTFV